jgi:hypothetical protein
MSSFMMAGSSLTPLSRTVCDPSGIAGVGQAGERGLAAGVSSSGWLKWTLTYTGWWRFTMSHSSGVIRSGRWLGIRVWIRMISMCGMARSVERKNSMRRSLSMNGSPPDRTTSRTSVCSRRYSNAASNWLSGIFSGSPDLAAAGAEAAVGGAHGGTRKRTRSG